MYDGNDVVADYTKSTSNPTLQRTYANGLSIDQKIGRFDSDGNASWHLRDRLNSTTAVIGNDGAVQNHYTSNAWGSSLHRFENNPQRYTFTGREEDRESGFMHFRARSYFPTIGRFMQRDPKNKFGKHYIYAANNPLLFIDPMGLDESIWEFWTRAFSSGVSVRPEVKRTVRSSAESVKNVANNPGAATSGFGRAFTEGKSADSLIGFINGLTEQLNPVGGGIGLDPVFGNFDTFEQGVAIGRVTGVGENAVLIAFSGPQVIKALRALKNLPGILKTARVATNTGQVVETVVVNSQAAAKAIKALRDAGVAGGVLSGQSAAILNAVREGGGNSRGGGNTSGRSAGNPNNKIPFDDFQDWGKGKVKWGSGPKDALKRARNISKAEAQALDTNKVKAAKRFYEKAAKAGRGGNTASLRAKLMEKILSLQN